MKKDRGSKLALGREIYSCKEVFYDPTLVSNAYPNLHIFFEYSNAGRVIKEEGCVSQSIANINPG